MRVYVMLISWRVQMSEFGHPKYLLFHRYYRYYFTCQYFYITEKGNATAQVMKMITGMMNRVIKYENVSFFSNLYI